MADLIKDLFQAVVEAVVEYVLHHVAHRIYRTQDTGRFGLMRATLLVSSIGGALAGSAGILGLSPFTSLSPLLILLWIPATLITMIGEYELGSRRLFWLVTAASAVFPVVGFATAI